MIRNLSCEYALGPSTMVKFKTREALLLALIANPLRYSILLSASHLLFAPYDSTRRRSKCRNGFLEKQQMHRTHRKLGGKVNGYNL